MRDAMLGSMIGGLIICALSWAVVAQSASERYSARSQLPSREAALHASGHNDWWAARSGR